MVQAVRHWQHYLFHREFILYTDHDAMKHLHSHDKGLARHVSWSAYLQQFTFVVKHKAGVANRVVDALSRQSTLLIAMRLEVLGFDSFHDLLDTDLYFFAIMSVVRADERTNFLLHDGFLSKGNRLCFLDYSLRLWIIQELHGEDHIGRDSTLQLVRDFYFWPSMRKEVECFVEMCKIYQVSKGKATNAGLYMPLPIPT